MNVKAALAKLFMPARVRRLVRLNDMITGYWVTQAIYVAAKLAIFDHLAGGPKSAQELATISESNSDALYRLLRALGGVGLLRELPNRRFALTRLGDHLRTGAPGSLRAWAVYNGETWHRSAWGHLAYTIKTGKAALEHTEGAPLFGYLAKEPEAAAIFDAAMADLATIDNVALVSGYQFGSASKVVDVGGGNGALLISILKTYPQMRGVLFDQADVVERARSKIDAASVRDRCTIVAGDFFASAPAGGDVYILKQVLHDWDDGRATRVLKSCAAAMTDTARLLIIEIVVPDETGPSLAKLTDLEMLVMTGGRERTAKEYQALAAAAGLKVFGLHSTHTPFTILECALVSVS